jgi:predicted nucleic acid-binding protein
MIIVDTSVWIDALRGTPNPHTLWLFKTIGKEEIGLTSLILAEVLQGIDADSEFRKTRQQLLDLTVYQELTTEIAVRSAENFRQLRSRGITVRKTIDCMIATFCIEEDHQLLHRDRDFHAFEKHLGLRVLHP